MIAEIKGYEGNYLIRDDGVVFTKRRQGTDSRILAQTPNSCGYLRVHLRNKSGKRSMLVHRLVAEAFIRKEEGKNFVNHKDGNKANNNVNNLEWCTRSENMKHAFKTGLSKVPALCGEKNPMCKVADSDVQEIKRLYHCGVSSGELGKKYGITKEQVLNYVHGKQRKMKVQAYMPELFGDIEGMEL